MVPSDLYISTQHWVCLYLSNDWVGVFCQCKQAPSEDLFGESAFQAAPSSAPDMFGAPAVQAAPPPSIPSLFPPPAFQQPTLPAKSVAAESLEAFGSGGSNDNGGSMFPPPQASPAFDFAPNNGSGFSQGAVVLQVQSFGNQSIGSTHPSSNVQSYSNNQPSGNSLSTNTKQTQLESMQMQPSINCSMLQPQQQPKKTFAPLKSTLWADTLSTGLVDLNIAGRMNLLCCHLLIYSFPLQVFIPAWIGYRIDNHQSSLCRLFCSVTP